MNRIIAFRTCLMMVICQFCLSAGTNIYAQKINFIYKGGEEGYSCFRIPAIVKTHKGTLLAFAEARRKNCEDWGDIDLVLKRSDDGGKTWGGIEMVWDDRDNTCGNPVPIVDARTGNIVLVTTWNLGVDPQSSIVAGTSTDTRRVFVLSSADDGHTWSSAKEITSSVKKDNWTWYATGPVSGIQLTKRKYKGRMVVPCDHIEGGTKKHFSHAIFSDDGGKTWVLGGITPQDKVGEATVAELSNGNLMLNMRQVAGMHYRNIAISKDGGKSWSDLRADSTLVEPVCQGSLIQYRFPGKGRALAFSNPASQASRINMTVRISFDDGKTWPLKKLLYSGPSAYSNLTVLPNGSLGCLYEAGETYRYEGIGFEEISPDGFADNTE